MLGGVYGAYVRSLSVDLRSSHNTLLCLSLRLVSLVSVHNIWVCKYALYDREGRMAKRIQFSVGPPSGIVDITCP